MPGVKVGRLRVWWWVRRLEPTHARCHPSEPRPLAGDPDDAHEWGFVGGATTAS